MAQFAVPLSFNKLDMKAYLRAAYNLKVLAVRSNIIQPPIEWARKGKGYQIRRRRSEKRMTIEMERPFLWPEEVKDFTKYDRDLYHAIEKYRDEMREGSRDQQVHRLEPKQERERIAKAVDKMEYEEELPAKKAR